MLEIDVPGAEYYDESANEFITYPSEKWTLEHSLLAISKWEAKWGIRFLDDSEKTPEQLYDYIKCMSIDGRISDRALRGVSQGVITEILDYIKSPQTATEIFNRRDHKHSSEKISSELLYYYMVANQIPFEAERWHINRLLMLIRICGIKSDPKGNKLSAKEAAMERHALNQARKAKRGHHG